MSRLAAVRSSRRRARDIRKSIEDKRCLGNGSESGRMHEDHKSVYYMSTFTSIAKVLWRLPGCDIR